MNIELYLVRHGQTEFNLAGKIQGWCDSPLTETGVAQAVHLGGQLRTHPFCAAFSSTLPRAHRTAELILAADGQNLPVHTLPQLREYCFGSYEQGYTVAIHEQVAQARGFTDKESWIAAYRSAERNLLIETVAQSDPSRTAETESALITRLHQALAEIARRSPPAGKVLAVSHGMAICALLKSIQPDCMPHQSPPNTSVSRLHFDGTHWRVLSVGETAF